MAVTDDEYARMLADAEMCQCVKCGQLTFKNVCTECAKRVREILKDEQD